MDIKYIILLVVYNMIKLKGLLQTILKIYIALIKTITIKFTFKKKILCWKTLLSLIKESKIGNLSFNLNLLNTYSP